MAVSEAGKEGKEGGWGTVSSPNKQCLVVGGGGACGLGALHSEIREQGAFT